MKRLSFLLLRMREKNNIKVKGHTLKNNILVEESMRGIMREVGHTLENVLVEFELEHEPLSYVMYSSSSI